MPCVAVHPQSSALQALGSAHGRLITRDFGLQRPPRRADLGPYGCTREFVHVAPEQPPDQAVEGIGFLGFRRAAGATCPYALTRASDR